MSNLGEIEKKTLGAMLMMSDNDGNVEAFSIEIAHKLGYKAMGGAITFALKSLEMNNYIAIMQKGNCARKTKYKVFI